MKVRLVLFDVLPALDRRVVRGPLDDVYEPVSNMRPGDACLPKAT